MSESLRVELTIQILSESGYVLQQSIVKLNEAELSMVNETTEEVEAIANWKNHRFTGRKTFTITGTALE